MFQNAASVPFYVSERGKTRENKAGDEEDVYRAFLYLGGWQRLFTSLKK